MHTFYSTMARLMAAYPQQFTLCLSGEQYTVRAELNSTFHQFVENQSSYDLNTHIKLLLHRVCDLKDSTIFFSSVPNDPNNWR
jgi:hypothetical protein